MNTFFVVALISLIIVIMTVLAILIIKIEKENITKTTQSLMDILDSKAFYPIEIHFINKHLSIALNKTKTKIAIVKNFNPNNPAHYEYGELALSFIEKIEKGFAYKIYYLKKGELKFLTIHPANNEIKEFIHNIFELSLIKRIETKLSAAQSQLQAIEQAEGQAIQRATPKFKGVG